MKGLKLSKTGWLILSAGIFIVILAALGVTRSQQLEEQAQLDEELSLSTTRVEKLQVADLRPQLEALQQRIEENEAQLTEAKDRLRQTVESTDVTEKFFLVAEYCGVKIMTLSTSRISKQVLTGIECNMISISTSVEGEVPNLIDYIISLNKGFTTGYIESAQITISEEPTDVSTASIQMVVYTYKGN